MWAAIGKFLGQLILPLFKHILKEQKKPEEVIHTGFDEEVQDEFEKMIEEDTKK